MTDEDVTLIHSIVEWTTNYRYLPLTIKRLYMTRKPEWAFFLEPGAPIYGRKERKGC